MTENFEGTIRPIEEGDLPVLVRFLGQESRASAGFKTGTEAYYRWKYLSSPVGLNAAHAAFVDGRMIGLVGVMARGFWIEGEEHLTSEFGDVFVEPQYRPQRVYKRILLQQLEVTKGAGVALSIGRPNAAATPGAKKAGWLEINPLELYTRPLAAEFVTERVTDNPALRNALLLPTTMALKLSLLPSMLGALGGVRVEQLSSFDERLDDLWQEARDRYPAMIVHDKTYMSWRYFEIPEEDTYDVFGALDRRERLLGVAVLARGESMGGEKHAEVVDLLTRSEDRGQIAYLLIGRALKEASERGFEALRCYIPSGMGVQEDPLLAAMRLHGFVTRHDQQTIVVQAQADEATTMRLVERGYWNFRGGDTDYI